MDETSLLKSAPMSGPALPAILALNCIKLHFRLSTWSHSLANILLAVVTPLVVKNYNSRAKLLMTAVSREALQKRENNR